MPLIRLHNPRKGRVTRRVAHRPGAPRRKRNLLWGKEGLTLMANPKRRHRRNRSKKGSVRHRARRSNPMYRARPRVRRRAHRLNPHRRHFRHRRNPAMLGDLKSLALDFAYLAGGGITTRSVPQLLIPTYNTGFVGYGLNLLVAAVTSAMIGKWRGPSAGRAWLLGGVAFTLSRAIDDYTGAQLVSFAQFTPGGHPMLSGDAGYGVGMSGLYKTASFVLPTDSLPALPSAEQAAAVAVAPTPTGMGWSTRWGGGRGGWN